MIYKLLELSPNWEISLANVETLAAHLSQIIALTSKPFAIKDVKQFKVSFFNQSLLMDVTGAAFMIYGTFSFNPMIMKHTILSYSSYCYYHNPTFYLQNTQHSFVNTFHQTV